LAVYSLPRDKAKLRSIFLSSSWKLHEAASCAEAVAALRVFPTPVVICDADQPDGSWRDILAHLALFRNPPRLIVASHNADDRLRAEALALGAHSVLSMPFHTAEVCKAVAPAWREWNEELSKLQTAVA
jgi:CheY-like chemotaxis protein